ncbi:TolC family protein [Aliivibrio finisterrensis]|uniref:Copper transporter n=1 Tax=Aliivibrio finisterrensis TaxID=511998 RepID=A0A4Q5KZ11_9GAMM|nr:copper transporter [Aliivibrio finisterrensis]RYU53417.1 copper transporter [Aliivibrio finisterrensis]RYU58504.1 copper transporter [Aliivibrio finisterrensis]RYU65923.1 copper transporter [Aliivibrio finisterrensis]RYU84219.1 copper transporter [Aliivibrio finisterrensis]
MKNTARKHFTKVWLASAISLMISNQVMAESQLTQLIEQALSSDASREQIYAQSQALRSTGIASSTLADPTLKVGFGGLPVDSFKFDEDPMTNISVGLMQKFGRGSSLDLQQKQTGQQADVLAMQVQVRELEVANAITQLWIELGFLQKAEAILHENRQLLSEMETYIKTNYSIGKSESQDLLQAQLQLGRLDEKLQTNRQLQGRIYAQLTEWLPNLSEQKPQGIKALEWSTLNKLLNSKANQDTEFYDLLKSNPTIKMSELAITATKTKVDIADESYSPQFGVEVMYAYRQANGMGGQPASDLVSAYVTMDLPLFTDKRQDQNYAAAQYQVGAAKSQRDVLLRQMNAKVNSLLVDKNNLEQRLSRYNHTLLPQAKDRTQAVERGYENNTAQFNDVISAASDELSIELEKQRLFSDLDKTYSNLAFYLNGFDYHVSAPQLSPSEQ